ncbi:class I SAM-dependent methyltransferase [Anaerocolumna xylanovorans]|uniref:O-Methyltransferase involved in polyketide biosynthesis n=1 Tax=Anaerocolumna xylanovorans DSM 12503 TaxID=1121345 RepID=A0A1M7YMV5_9FIRM|nr:class I SAM-dependent methyltransferase [Anaerocolumna xylanovorans]SHO53979.1 O-Methyltransferase involved in polyketide biosynthesis [Anaerocolumna xylanovorans DSM 12503]
MEQKITLQKQTVQSTMLLPLWGRAVASEKNPDILYDRQAIDIIKNCDYDFSSIAKTFGEFGGICYVVRARKMEDAIRQFIKKHPRATIVNIGAGLDTSFSRVDNGTIRWYNLDLPDSIAFRQSFIPDSERNVSIAKSLFDTSWFDQVSFNPQDGIFFISGGVFYYFKEEQLQEIFCSMAKRFPGGELYFDAESRQTVKKSNRMVQKTGNKGAIMYFCVNNAKELENWSPLIHLVSCEKYFKGIPFNPQWSSGIRFMARVSDWMGMMKFVHLGFAE